MLKRTINNKDWKESMKKIGIFIKDLDDSNEKLKEILEEYEAINAHYQIYEDTLDKVDKYLERPLPVWFFEDGYEEYEKEHSKWQKEYSKFEEAYKIREKERKKKINKVLKKKK